MEQKSTLMPGVNERKYLTTGDQIHCIFTDGGRKDANHDVIIPKGVRCKVRGSTHDEMIEVLYNGEKAIITQDRFKEVFGDETIYQSRVEKDNFSLLCEENPLLSDKLIDNEGTKANFLTVKRTIEKDGTKKYMLTISQEYDVKIPFDEKTGKGGIKDVEKYTQAPVSLEIAGYHFDKLYSYLNKKPSKLRADYLMNG